MPFDRPLACSQVLLFLSALTLYRLCHGHKGEVNVNESWLIISGSLRKFGKQIQKRQLEVPEYAASFVNYKALKKVCTVLCSR